MIQHRQKGISRLVLIAQCLLVAGLYGIWVFFYLVLLPGLDGLNLLAYSGYGAAFLGGLIIHSALAPAHTPLRTFTRRGLLEMIPHAIRQTLAAVGFLLFVLVISKDRYLSRAFLFSFIPALFLVLLVSGQLLPGWFARHLFRGNRIDRVVLIGSPKRAALIKPWLQSKTQYGCRTVGILTSDHAQSSPWLPVLGGPEDLDRILSTHQITQVLLLQLPDATANFSDVLETVQRHGSRLVILSNLEEQLQHKIFAFEEAGLSFFSLHQEPLENPFNRVLKRSVDLGLAIPVVLFVLPVVSVLVRVSQLFQSRGPLFYRQTRAGIQNRAFSILKYRTMYPHDEETRQVVEGDRRIYPAGRLLRRYSLDELPQFLNVLTGEMSVVGPRPHLLQHNAKFSAVLSNYHVRAFVKPGITGLAQVRGFRGEATTQSEIAQRLQSDLSYLEHWSLALDTAIIARTILQMIFPPRSAR